MWSSSIGLVDRGPPRVASQHQIVVQKVQTRSGHSRHVHAHWRARQEPPGLGDLLHCVGYSAQHNDHRSAQRHGAEESARRHNHTIHRNVYQNCHKHTFDIRSARWVWVPDPVVHGEAAKCHHTESNKANAGAHTWDTTRCLASHGLAQRQPRSYSQWCKFFFFFSSCSLDFLKHVLAFRQFCCWTIWPKQMPTFRR